MRCLGLVILSSMVLIAGCGESAQQKESRINANLQLLGEKYVKEHLKDPGSAQFQNQFIGRKGVPCGEVNSKNSFGGYTGFKRYISVGKDLTVIEDGNMSSSEFETSWGDICK